MIHVIEGHVVLTAAGLTLAIFAAGLLFGGIGALLGAWCMRGHYVAEVGPEQVEPAEPLTIVLPGPHGGHWPAYRPGRAPSAHGGDRGTR